MFNAATCAACHRERLPVSLQSADGSSAGPDTIGPYTDLRLHDLGPGLADRTVAGRRIASRWRTAPLWGMAYRLRQESMPTFLHDGRARSIEEAILWHAGEASAARRQFERLPDMKRRRLLRWIEAL